MRSSPSVKSNETRNRSASRNKQKLKEQIHVVFQHPVFGKNTCSRNSPAAKQNESKIQIPNYPPKTPKKLPAVSLQ